MDFLNLLPERKRIMAKLMAEKNDILSLDRLVNGESQEFMTVYEAWKASKDDPGYATIPDLPVDPTPSSSTQKDIIQITRGLELHTLQEASSTGTSTKNETVQNMPDVHPEVFEKLPKELTVVFLGETGVGKSTFINGLVNYLKYATLHEARQKGVEILIKAYFTLSDSDYNRLEIKCEPTIKVEKSAEVGNEVTEAGQSCTQFPKSYKFVWTYGGEERVIRIIDTPGVGDVRGVGKEKENFHQILSFLADFKKINAICILLKPNEARLTIGFRYCVNELLSHLHVSAAKNILFCFTNARQTLYCPGETLGTLESHLAILRKERQIDIPLNKNTMFCFDNESFRFLCALNKGAKFNPKEIDNFNGSWIKTVEETFRLFGRIAELDAHDVEKTLSVNNIRSVILALSRPLAEIARNQLLNAQLIDERTKEVARPRLIEDRVQIQTRVDQGKDLTGRLYVDQVKIETKKIDHPITVCAAAKCVEHMRFDPSQPNSPMQTVYKTKCHEKCYLKGVQEEQFPNPALQRCWALHENIQKCRTCGCEWSTHLHIKYVLAKKMEKEVDPTVQASLNRNENELKAAKLFIEKLAKKKEELIKESEKISSHCSEFAAFLRKNSILPYNDAYKDYVDHLIREETDKGIKDNGVLDQLKNYKQEYEQQVKILDEQQKRNAKGTKSIEQIYAMVTDLKKLKHSGKVVEDIQKLEMLSVRDKQINTSTSVNLNGGWLDNFSPRNKTGRVFNYIQQFGRKLP